MSDDAYEDLLPDAPGADPAPDGPDLDPLEPYLPPQAGAWLLDDPWGP